MSYPIATFNPTLNTNICDHSDSPTPKKVCTAHIKFEIVCGLLIGLFATIYGIFVVSIPGLDTPAAMYSCLIGGPIVLLLCGLGTLGIIGENEKSKKGPFWKMSDYIAYEENTSYAPLRMLLSKQPSENKQRQYTLYKVYNYSFAKEPKVYNTQQDVYGLVQSNEKGTTVHLFNEIKSRIAFQESLNGEGYTLVKDTD